jgi:hypothetical protein
MFNSYVTNYQRVNHQTVPLNPIKSPLEPIKITIKITINQVFNYQRVSPMKPNMTQIMCAAHVRFMGHLPNSSEPEITNLTAEAPWARSVLAAGSLAIFHQFRS